jgi:hypothetical protein
MAHADLGYLRRLPSAELRGLRAQVTAALFDHQGALAKLAGATKLLPTGLVASLSEKAFGPTLTARIAGLVEPERAVDIAMALPIPFLAQVATELDPRRVAAILGRIPPETVAAVARELIAAQEWIAAGTFYGYLPDESITAAIQAADPHALLHISLVLEDKSRLAYVLDIAGAETLEQVVSAAEAEGLTEQLTALSVYLTSEQQAQLRM